MIWYTIRYCNTTLHYATLYSVYSIALYYIIWYYIVLYYIICIIYAYLAWRESRAMVCSCILQPRLAVIYVCNILYMVLVIGKKIVARVLPEQAPLLRNHVMYKHWHSPCPSVRWIYARSATPFAAWCGMKNTDRQVSKIKRGLGVEKECSSISIQPYCLGCSIPSPSGESSPDYKLIFSDCYWVGQHPNKDIIVWLSINTENVTALVSILKAHWYSGWIHN